MNIYIYNHFGNNWSMHKSTVFLAVFSFDRVEVYRYFVNRSDPFLKSN